MCTSDFTKERSLRLRIFASIKIKIELHTYYINYIDEFPPIFYIYVYKILSSYQIFVIFIHLSIREKNVINRM